MAAVAAKVAVAAVSRRETTLCVDNTWRTALGLGLGFGLKTGSFGIIWASLTLIKASSIGRRMEVHFKAAHPQIVIAAVV